jgi:hypothetical protein
LGDRLEWFFIWKNEQEVRAFRSILEQFWPKDEAIHQSSPEDAPVETQRINENERCTL